ncbi:MvH Hase/Heterodisulfide reductase, subunit A-like protein [Desulfamplus magnetovallimortis]|uniref:MvH Hase/Heterodisulfide reductase, subunit A-like protein n=2 Tax=Desulfamplus magnetovallimortis TaxID=1246637 RepID=A0A1W1HCY8_9BACT|nr:MvH Hase/Heterodisulfide reductase, subunit A-like protein [Desulfamplus magnetovallimortis]
MEKCIACGLCAEKCPKKVDDEFNMGISKRKAVYIKYGQAVPLKYAIDPEQCIYLTRGKCRACEKFCPTGAINFEDKEEIVTIDVGSVILAPGFKPFDPSVYDVYGYGKIEDVVTSLDYERLLSASGPNMGHLIRPSDHQEPKKIAWLQCVGSRNNNRCDNTYCSSVCCMYAIKQALVTAEHLSGDDISQTIFFMDLRSHGKDFEGYYENAKTKGVNFVRARPHTIDPGPEGVGVSIRFTTETGETFEELFDMAVLSIGLEASGDSMALADTFGIELDMHHFAKTGSFEPVNSSRTGVFVTGAFQAPKAIPRSVAQASAAASSAATLLADARGSMTRNKEWPEPRDIRGETPAIGVFVCSCGINISNVVDVEAVAKYAATLPNVVHVENNLFTCSADTQELIAEKIKEHGLNRIVIAACTPRTHEPLFQETLKDAKLNGFMVEMANIRNQNAWVHQREPEKATQKAKDQVRMAVAKITYSSPLNQETLNVTPKALVVGGGIAGMTSALAIADQGFETLIMEKNNTLGGNALALKMSFRGEIVKPMLDGLIEKVSTHPKISVATEATLKYVSGSVGNFKSEISINGTLKQIQYGVAVMAIGGREGVPTEYHYGEDRRVMTHLEFDAQVMESIVAESEKAAAPDKGKMENPQSVVFIQCVGSREPERPYCSRICCVHSVKTAIQIKEKSPETQVFILNRDIRTYGVWEDYYQKARELGVIFIRYEVERKPVVNLEENHIAVKVTDPILQLPLDIEADYLVLASGVIPNQSRDLVEVFKCSASAEGFLNEAHPKLRPVDMSVDGLFVAGMCNYPKPIDEAIEQAKAAASRACVVLSKETMKLDAVKSFVTDKCDGCALCVDVCPYNAISLETVDSSLDLESASYAETEKCKDSVVATTLNGESHNLNGSFHRRIVTDSALCKGCGICFATCPKEGIMVHGFTMNELKAQVTAAIA